MFLDENDKFSRNMKCVLFLSYLSLMLYVDYQTVIVICEKLKIKYDLVLITTSAGFGNDMIMLSIFSEIIIFGYVFEKLIPKIIHKLF